MNTNNFKNSLAKKIVFLFVLILFFPISSFSSQFDDLGVAARPLGMGNAFTALANDATSIYYNPAGLALLRNIEFIAAYDRLYMGLTDGSNIGGGFAALALPFSGIGTIGLAWLNLNLLNYYQENTFTLSYGLEVLPSLYLGSSLKILTKSFGEDEYTRIDKLFLEKGYRTMGISGDFGIIYRFAKCYSLAFTVTDFVEPDMGLKDSDKVALGLKLGFAYRLSGLDLVTDLAYKEKDWDVYLGAEKWFLSRTIGVRAGLGIGSRENRTIAMGGSYNTSNLQFDYAFLYPLTGVLNTYGSHRVSITMRFGQVVPESEMEFSDIREQLQEELDEVKKEAENAKVLVFDLTEKIDVLEEQRKIIDQKNIDMFKKQLDETSKQLNIAKQIAENTNKKLKETEERLSKVPAVKVEEKKPEEKPVEKPKEEVKEEKPKTYTVVEGDSLESIAEKIYKNKNKWIDIYKANKENIKRGSLTPGQILIIP